MSKEQYEKLRAKIDMADDMFGELPDGAYWSACEEVGAGQDVQLAVDDYERKNKLGVYQKSEDTNN